MIPYRVHDPPPPTRWRAPPVTHVSSEFVAQAITMVAFGVLFAWAEMPALTAACFAMSSLGWSTAWDVERREERYRRG